MEKLISKQVEIKKKKKNQNHPFVLLLYVKDKFKKKIFVGYCIKFSFFQNTNSEGILKLDKMNQGNLSSVIFCKEH
jgi:hypothetical protein